MDPRVGYLRGVVLCLERENVEEFPFYSTGFLCLRRESSKEKQRKKRQPTREGALGENVHRKSRGINQSKSGT